MGQTLMAAETIVVTDTSVLVNFLALDRVNLLASLPARRFLITDHVRDEVTAHYPEQLDRLTRAIASRLLEEISVTDPVEVQLFAELTRTGLGAGSARRSRWPSIVAMRWPSTTRRRTARGQTSSAGVDPDNRITDGPVDSRRNTQHCGCGQHQSCVGTAPPVSPQIPELQRADVAWRPPFSTYSSGGNSRRSPLRANAPDGNVQISSRGRGNSADHFLRVDRAADLRWLVARLLDRDRRGRRLR